MSKREIAFFNDSLKMKQLEIEKKQEAAELKTVSRELVKT